MSTAVIRLALVFQNSKALTSETSQALLTVGYNVDIRKSAGDSFGILRCLCYEKSYRNVTQLLKTKCGYYWRELDIINLCIKKRLSYSFGNVVQMDENKYPNILLQGTRQRRRPKNRLAPFKKTVWKWDYGTNVDRGWQTRSVRDRSCLTPATQKSGVQRARLRLHQSLKFEYRLIGWNSN